MIKEPLVWVISLAVEWDLKFSMFPNVFFLHSADPNHGSNSSVTGHQLWMLILSVMIQMVKIVIPFVMLLLKQLLDCLALCFSVS